MGGYRSSVYQVAATAPQALAIARHAVATLEPEGYPLDGIRQKDCVQQLHNTTLTRSHAEALADELLDVPTPGQSTRLVCLDNIPPYADHYSSVAGTIPIADHDGGPTVAWLLFGVAND